MECLSDFFIEITARNADPAFAERNTSIVESLSDAH
jgi:hypothetical protein